VEKQMAIWHKKGLSFGLRLFVSHILVVIVAVTTLALVSKVYSHRLFFIHIERIEQELEKAQFRGERSILIESFWNAWNYGNGWAALAGITTGISLSYWIAKKFTQPLKEIERVTKNFARGNLEERLPRVEIEEINRLSVSVNNMATSLQGIEQRRRELMSDVSHELRTPLTIIYSYLEAITSQKIEPNREIYELLMRETKRLQQSIDDLQLLSQIEMGHLNIYLQPIQIYLLLSSAIVKFSEQLFDDLVVIHLDCQSSLPPVLADSDRLEEVILNLLGNALSYTEKGSITLKAWTKNRQMWIAVIDTGRGISPEDLPFVFERFWRSGSARAKNKRGSGIGLAIARRSIELLGGKIEVESTLGKGSTFRFCLPIA
jgi:signal transduction histidine kinase